MCKNATQQLGNAMKAIEPTLVQFEEVTGVSKTEQGEAAITAFNALQVELSNWQPGDDITVAVEAINTFDSVFQTLPVPEDAKALAGVISAGVDVILGILEANKTAPAAPAITQPAAGAGSIPAAAVQEGIMASMEPHQAAALDKATKAVQAKVPTFQPSKTDRVRAAMGDHHVFAREYTHHWNATVDASDPKYAVLKQ